MSCLLWLSASISVSTCLCVFLILLTTNWKEYINLEYVRSVLFTVPIVIVFRETSMACDVSDWMTLFTCLFSVTFRLRLEVHLWNQNCWHKSARTGVLWGNYSSLWRMSQVLGRAVFESNVFWIAPRWCLGCLQMQKFLRIEWWVARHRLIHFSFCGIHCSGLN